MKEDEEIKGLVERVTFHNEESGFAVLKIKIKGKRDLLTIVGSVPVVNLGEWVAARGKWVQNREYGMQLKADWIQTSPPTTRDGMEKYLASGMVKGIGPVYAAKLVEKFGEKIFDIIENESKRLESVAGIGEGRRKKIKEAWNEQKVVRDIMVFLHAHGVSTSRATRIYKTYGEEAIGRVRKNPFRLAKDIHGIGFQTADIIASQLEIKPDAPFRIAAGIDHVLWESSREGHCALPKEELLQKTEHLLKIEIQPIEEELESLLKKEELILDGESDPSLIFLPLLKRAEEEVASKVKALNLTPPTYPEVEVENAIEWCQKKVKVELAESQKTAIRVALENRCVVITGGPGVGKTTLLKALLSILRAKKVQCLLCAPTGRAAKRMREMTGMEAKTIHRLLEYNPRQNGFIRNEENPLEADLVVIDETSMVDLQLFHHLLKAISLNSHVIMVGDVDQLPSVGPGNILRDVIQSQCVPVIRLTEIFRQAADSHIIVNAHRINEGILPFEEKKESDFYFISREDSERTLSTLITLVKERIPIKFKFNSIREVQVLCAMNRGSLGTRNLNIELQKVLNPLRKGEESVERFGWEFRPRDKVIQMVNNYDKEVFNGDIGFIESIDLDNRLVFVSFDEQKVEYDFGELDELTLAYAISVHKSQGSEFPVVVIPVAMQQFMMLQRNLIYTAVTRGKELVVLVGEEKSIALAVNNKKDGERYGALKRLLETST